MKVMFLVIGFIFMVGCASSDIAKYGKDSYIAYTKDPWSMSRGRVSVDAARAANQFCEEKGMVMIVRNTASSVEFDGASANLVFSCVSESDSENQRPNLSKQPDTVIEVHQK